jgi:Fic family protein
MDNTTFNILPHNPVLFASYRGKLADNLAFAFAQLQSSDFTAENFKFYTSVSVIASSKIEGEPMEVDSYIKHKMQNIDYVPELTEKPNDLFAAYTFAQQSVLTKGHFAEAHALLSKHLLPEKDRGVCRKNDMLVMEHNTGRIQYEAAPANIVAKEYDKLWDDIELLLATDIEVEQTFYFASLIHLVFVNIHPFNDGNGRAARLLEKWFLAQKLGEKAWFIASEKYYYQHVEQYYRNLAILGMFYQQLDYKKAIPFLTMLPQAIGTKENP